MSAYELDSRLRDDCIALGELRLCRVLLMNESRYPWCILVPARANIRETFELSPDDRDQLWRETNALTAAMQTEFGADKMNVAALGNVVAQLHVHVIARFKHDAAWPAPVWGQFTPEPYPTDERQEAVARLTVLLDRVRSQVQ